MARIYTRTGDGGDTALFGGQRVPKSDARVDAYGGVDELNSAIGVAVAHMAADGNEQLAALLPVLSRIQAELLEIGGVLADPRRSEELVADSAAENLFATENLERAIDTMEEDLQPLKNFILPGGGVVAAHLHLVRTVCRRVERQVVALAAVTAVPPPILVYLNRLSDTFFVAARWANHCQGIEDITWRPQA